MAVEAVPSDMAAARSTKRRPKRARRSVLASLSMPRFELEPHHVDIIGLALIAVGIFLAGVAYLRWSGGALGGGAITGTRFVFGALGYTVPAALVLGGALVLIRELRPPGRPLRAGVSSLTAALTLALAAGTLGVGPGATSARAFWHAHAFESRGGVVGQGELWLASHLLSTLGAHILAVFLFAAGLILISGATLSSVLRVTRDAATTVIRTPHTSRPQPAEPIAPPDPDTAELVVRATHVEAPPIEHAGRAGTGRGAR